MSAAWHSPRVNIDIYDGYGFYDDIVTVLTITARSATAAGDQVAEAATLNDLGEIHIVAGRL